MLAGGGYVEVGLAEGTGEDLVCVMGDALGIDAGDELSVIPEEKDCAVFHRDVGAQEG